MENINIIDYESNEKIIKSLKIFKDEVYGLNSSLFYLKNNILLKLLNKPMDEYMIDILIFIRKLETKTINYTDNKITTLNDYKKILTLKK